MSERPEHMEPPLNPLPPVVWALVLPMIVIEAVLQLAGAGLIGGRDGVGWRLMVLERMAFVPEQLVWMWQTRQVPLNDLARLVGYAFVHVSLSHAAFVVVFVMALGKFISDVFRPWAVAVLFLGSAIGAMLIYTLVLSFAPALRLESGQMLPIVGGYPGAFGLIGAFTFVLWLRLGQSGGSTWRAFSLIGFMMAVRLVFGVLFGGGPDWVADLAGFAMGFGLAFVVVPGGPARLLAHLRQR